MALGAGDTTVARLVNAYSILANHGQSVTPTIIDYVQDRNGKVIYRSDNRCAVMQGCNAPDWNGQPMPRPPVAFSTGRIGSIGRVDILGKDPYATPCSVGAGHCFVRWSITKY